MDNDQVLLETLAEDQENLKKKVKRRGQFVIHQLQVVINRRLSQDLNLGHTTKLT